MKCSLTALFVIMSAIAMANPALANEENIFPVLVDQNRAAALVTQPATIINGTLNITDRTNNLKKVSESIGIVREGCKKINPLEMIKSPGNTFKQCLEDTNNQAAQINQTSQPTEKFDFFKIPELESGINVTVTKF